MPTRRKISLSPNAPLLSRIDVEELFYTYTYTLKPAYSIGPESGRLMLLYGNNGTGKTTILNLLYHLLHPEPYGGHRSFVGRIPFKKFQVHLLDGASVTASRAKKYDPGDYDIRASYPSQGKQIEWTWSPTRRRGAETEEEKRYQEFCLFLTNLGIAFHYLQDTRRIEGDVRPRHPMYRRRLENMADDILLVEEEIDEQEETLSPKKQLQRSIDAAIQWFRQKALMATNVGYTSVNSIYRDLIKRIVTPGPPTEKATNAPTEKLIEELIHLKGRNSGFAKFGLTPELDIGDITSSLKSAQPRQVTMLNTVLGPYLEGHQARLDALQEVQGVMESFVSLLAKFYSHKRATVHLERGLQIQSDTGHDLMPQMLSSGEKQLLLLFCNAISARRDKTILMIDEPEISLNVTWQRELIPALLTCMSGTAFQVILATHSIELLAQYRESVTSLEDPREG